MSKKRIFGLAFLCLIVPAFIYMNNGDLRKTASNTKTFQFLDVPVKKTVHSLKQLHESTPTIKNPEKEASRRKMVVILAYMHTGSTYLGSILQNHQESFYEYEALRSLMYSTHASKTIYFLNGTERKLTKDPNPQNIHHNVDPKLGAEAIENMVTCQHDKLDIATLANHYFPLTSMENLHTKDFFRCQERLFGSPLYLHARDAVHYVDNKMLHSINRSKTIIEKCMPIIKQRCNSSSLVVEKVIRMTMKMADILLTNLPEVKIIHLVRDPRAMLDSQSRKGDTNANNPIVLRERIKYMCNQMKADLLLVKTLKVAYPGQIRTVRYEDMVKSQISVIEGLFEFIDIPFTPEDKEYIKAHDRTNKNKISSKGLIPGKKLIDNQTRIITRKILSLPNYMPNRPRATYVRPQMARSLSQRKVSSPPRRQLSWREHLSELSLQALNTHCSEVYEMLGYVKFANRSELLDMKKSNFIPISLN
ncbi:hypothetical protein ACF0H5_013983 [Mactra antiquata]